MPPVIVAAASLAAFSAVSGILVTWGASAFFSTLFGSVVAYGVGYAGNRVFGMGGAAAELSPFARPDTWLTNGPNSQRPIPVIYGERRVGGTVVFAEVSGSQNEYLDVVYAICEGPVEEIGQMYLDDGAVPETIPSTVIDDPVDREVLVLQGHILRQITIRIRLVEASDVTESSGDLIWADLQTWASDTYAGLLELERGSQEGGIDPGWEFALVAAPFVYAGEPGDLQISLEVPDRVIRGVAVSIVEQPTAENAHTAVIRMSRVLPSIGTPETAFSLSITATAHTPGDTQYLGVVLCNRHLGADNQVADSDLAAASSTWTLAHSLKGIAYAYVRYVFDRHRWPRGIPQASWVVKGRLVYDPRSETSYWSANPALCILDSLANERYGRGLALEDIDLESFESVADYCDEEVEDHAGATESRYTCNGVLDTGRTLKGRLESILPSCRSWLVFASGQYRLIADRPSDPVMTFTEDNIVGDWQIDLGDTAGLANRVGAVFWDPLNNWRPGSVLVDNELARSTEDRGVMLERELQLEYTTSRSMAWRIAALAANAARLPMVVTFTAMPEGIRCLPGDVVAITHSRPGWVDQLLRIVEMRPRPDGHVEIAGRQYSEAAYDHGAILIGATAPGTTMPTPLEVTPPGRPELAEELYVTRDGQGVKVRLLISLSADASPANSWTRGYMIEVVGPADSPNPFGRPADWRPVGYLPVESASMAIHDVTPGLWSVRAFAVNHLDVLSPASDVATLEVTGLAAPPAEVAGLSGYALSSMAVLSWDRHPDPDVRIGGMIRIRIYPGAGTPAWDDGLELGHVPGISEGGIFPLLAGTYMAKAVDSTGQESTSLATVALQNADHQTWTMLTTFAPAPNWTGTHDDTEAVSDDLQLEVSGWALAALAGQWTAAATTDLGSVKTVRLRSSITSAVVDLATSIDLRQYAIDSWETFDGETSLVIGMRAHLLVRYSDDNTTWSSWRRFLVTDVRCRYLQWRVALISGSNTHNVVVSDARATVEELV